MVPDGTVDALLTAPYLAAEEGNVVQTFGVQGRIINVSELSLPMRAVLWCPAVLLLLLPHACMPPSALRGLAIYIYKRIREKGFLCTLYRRLHTQQSTWHSCEGTPQGTAPCFGFRLTPPPMAGTLHSRLLLLQRLSPWPSFWPCDP